MSMIKKILAAALAVLMLVAMTACGKECDYCGQTIKGEAIEGKYCKQNCAMASKGCARCGRDIKEVLAEREEENKIKDATNPIPGMSEPEPNAIVLEGKMYCCEDCAYQ